MLRGSFSHALIEGELRSGETMEQNIIVSRKEGCRSNLRKKFTKAGPRGKANGDMAFVDGDVGRCQPVRAFRKCCGCQHLSMTALFMRDPMEKLWESSQGGTAILAQYRRFVR
ncbi:hypothetical protein A0U42_10305 [Megasphaera sp. DISK 18]|nr:hypothetical protein A0U42_10305 [Megasphaera sp. DISK 18]